MNGVEARLRAWLTWALPFVVVALLVGWETDFGHGLRPVPALDAQVPAQPAPVALLPEYKIDGGIESRRETVERTLFNPTRRPAPPQTAAAGKPAIQPGQFVLTGTTVVEQKATAFLREVNGGRSRRVQQGETINGVLVSEVRADRVKLTAGDQVEELTLKVAAGPKTTIQPAAPVPSPQGAVPVPSPQPVPAAAAAPQPGQQQEVAEVLAQRRRAARAAEAAAQQGAQVAQPAQVQPQSTPAAPAAQQPVPGPVPGDEWLQNYRRSQGQQ